jgi:hypothetical protein
MATLYSPRIVTNGLVLYLDAANPRSYPGSGTSWFDLSGNKFHMSLKNSPTFDSTNKVFELDGVNDYGACDGTVSDSVVGSVTNLGIGGDTPKTVVAVCQMRDIGVTTQGLFDLGDTGVNGRHYCLRLNGSYTAWRAQFWGDGPDYDFTYDGRNNFTFYSVVYRTDKIGRTYGNNGVLLGQDASAFTLVTAGSRPFEMGRYQGSNYGGFKVQSYMVYNKGLTDEEILQNYNATRSRFGV